MSGIISSNGSLPRPMDNLVKDIADFQFIWVRPISAVQESSSDNHSPLSVHVRPATLASSA
jgi:hypothetical protein